MDLKSGTFPFHVKTSENLKTFKDIKNWTGITCNCRVSELTWIRLVLKFLLPCPAPVNTLYTYFFNAYTYANYFLMKL